MSEIVLAEQILPPLHESRKADMEYHGVPSQVSLGVDAWVMRYRPVAQHLVTVVDRVLDIDPVIDDELYDDLYNALTRLRETFHLPPRRHP